MLRRIATLSVALPLLSGGLALAEDPVPRTTEERSTEMRRADADANQARAAYTATRLSKSIGASVYGSDGKKLGDIKDLVLDGNSNHVSYAVLSYGGVLGMGDKYFAVPWGALKHDINDKTMLSVTSEQLKDAPGFDKEHWPDMADAAFRQQVDTFYHYDRNAAAGHRAMDDNAQAANTGQMKMSKGLVWTRRASVIIGANVTNNANEGLGDIKDLVADSHSGQIDYAILSFGGVLGIGEKLSAVPMASLQTKADSQKFVLDVTKDRLKNAPTFADNQWPNFADGQFRANVDEFYGKAESKEGTAKTE